MHSNVYLVHKKLLLLKIAQQWTGQTRYKFDQLTVNLSIQKAVFFYVTALAPYIFFELQAKIHRYTKQIPESLSA